MANLVAAVLLICRHSTVRAQAPLASGFSLLTRRHAPVGVATVDCRRRKGRPRHNSSVLQSQMPLSMAADQWGGGNAMRHITRRHATGLIASLLPAAAAAQGAPLRRVVAPGAEDV